MKVVIAGSSGFIGSNLAAKLMAEGHEVIGLDIVAPKYFKPTTFIKVDLSESFDIVEEIYASYLPDVEDSYLSDVDEFYCLACCMGGMGYIGDEAAHGYDIAIGSTKIVSNVIDLCRINKVKKVFFSSSACVYNQQFQSGENSVSLSEEMAYPAYPDLLYGWQKLFAEKMFLASGLNVRIARFHNIFGKWGTYDGGKEKAPAAIMRKIIQSKEGGEIEIWGDGTAQRSFLHIDECLIGVHKLMASEYRQPINIGSDNIISIKWLANLAMSIAQKRLSIKYVDGNVGVQSRNSDNTLCQQVLNWKPEKPLSYGMSLLYDWLKEQIG